MCAIKNVCTLHLKIIVLKWTTGERERANKNKIGEVLECISLSFAQMLDESLLVLV